MANRARQQTPPAQPGPNNNAVNTAGQNNSDAPVAGRNSFTEGQAKSKIEDAGYSFVGPHSKVHEIFVRRVVELRTRFERGEDVLAQLHDMLSRWLFNHIRHEDGAYVPTVKAHLRATESSAEMLVKEQVRKELQQGRSDGRAKQGWLKRLFAG